MNIHQINLECFHLEKMKQFYTQVLEMNLLTSSNQSFTVEAGATKITFEKTEYLPYYHVCFRTGKRYFDTIFHKLSNLNRLLKDEKGETSFYWKGNQAYFTDPDGNILELLERPFQNKLGSNQDGWHDVAEIGMPSHNIKEFQEKLSFYILDEVKATNETFAFFGDKEGCLVLVKEGRHWYPTDRGATIHPIKLVVSGKENGKFAIPSYPYEVNVIRK